MGRPQKGPMMNSLAEITSDEEEGTVFSMTAAVIKEAEKQGRKKGGKRYADEDEDQVFDVNVVNGDINSVEEEI